MAIAKDKIIACEIVRPKKNNLFYVGISIEESGTSLKDLIQLSESKVIELFSKKEKPVKKLDEISQDKLSSFLKEHYLSKRRQNKICNENLYLLAYLNNDDALREYSLGPLE